MSFEAVRDDFQFVESLGLSNAWVGDHFALDDASELILLEAWSLLGALAVETDRIRIGTLVTNISTRNPALLAKAISTVDQISRGRLDAGVGSGSEPREHAALGIDFLDGGSRRERLREGVEILDRTLRGERVSYRGTYFTLHEAAVRPLPLQSPRPPLWVAGQTADSLRTAVRHGDVVVCFGEKGKPADEAFSAFRSRMAAVDDLCRGEGRDPSTLRRCYYAGFADEPIFESESATADFIGRYVEAGATDFSFYLLNPADPDLDYFAGTHRMATRDKLPLVAETVLPAVV